MDIGSIELAFQNIFVPCGGCEPFGFQFFNHGGLVSVDRDTEKFCDVFFRFLRLQSRSADESNGYA